MFLVDISSLWKVCVCGRLQLTYLQLHPKLPQTIQYTPVCRTFSDTFMTKVHGCNHSMRTIIPRADHSSAVTTIYC